MKHIKIYEDFANDSAINEASSNEFMNMKMEIYAEAKKEYLEAIKNELTKVGFTVNKIDAKYDQFEYSNDTIDCTYKGENVNLTMSISGSSLGVSNLDINGYTTKAAVLAKKLDKLLK